jgi:hypothetical protein
MSLIEKPAEVIGSLVLRLITIQYRRRRERFSEILEPLFEQFQKIHEHYTKLLDKYESSLPVSRHETDDGIERVVSEEGEVRRMSRSEERQAIAEIIKEAKLSSTVTEPIRKLFRANSADLLSNVRDEEERRFLFCLLAYFGSTIHTDVNWQDREQPGISATIERVLSSRVSTEAYLEALQSTSIGESIEDLLLETPEDEYPKKFIWSTRQWIDEAYVQIGREYQRLKYTIIQKAPI